MDDSQDDIHPLDRDYAAPPTRAARPSLEPNVKLRRIGFMIFLAGMALLVLMAIMLGNVKPGPLETAGSRIHRLSMVAVLVGGLLALLSYQMPRFEKLKVRSKVRRSNRWRSFGLLVSANIILCALAPVVGYTVATLFSQSAFYLTVSSLITVLCVIAATMIVVHDGMLRAYGIGIVVSTLLRSNLAMSFATIGMNVGRYGTGGIEALYWFQLVMIPLGGLAAAGYVCMVGSLRSRAESRESR